MTFAFVTLFIVGSLGLHAAYRKQQREMKPARVRIDARR
jgi:preprotein translocase subunit SecG